MCILYKRFIFSFWVCTVNWSVDRDIILLVGGGGGGGAAI